MTTSDLAKFLEKWDYDQGAPKAFRTAGDTASLAETIERHYVVIPRADLPEVTVWDDTSVRVHHVVYTTDHKGDYRADALARLAIAEYLEKNPPVDQAQLNALIVLLEGADDLIHDTDSTYEDLARRLLATGRVTIKEA